MRPPDGRGRVHLVLEYAGITSNDHFTFRMRFEGERVVVNAQETAHELGATFQGHLQRP